MCAQKTAYQENVVCLVFIAYIYVAKLPDYLYIPPFAIIGSNTSLAISLDSFQLIESFEDEIANSYIICRSSLFNNYDS